MLSVSNLARCMKVLCVLAVIMFIGSPVAVRAENRLGGHFGFVIPLVNRAGGETTTVADDFVVGFPTGITVKKNDKVAFDLEFVPVIQNSPLNVDLTVHPGVIFSLPNRFALGLRMAFDVNKASWGFTPLLNRSFPINSGASFFTELVLPIRIQSDSRGSNQGSVGFGIHLGVGF